MAQVPTSIPNPSTPAPASNPAVAPNEKDTKVNQPGSNIASGATAPSEPKLGQGGEQAVQKKFKIKVDGSELELDEPEVIRRAQLSSAAYKKFEEANKLKQQNEQLINMFRNNFTDLLDDPRLGIDETSKQKMLDDYYRRKYIEPSTLTPEQRKLKEAEAEIQRYRDGEKQKKQQEEQTQLEQLEKYHAQNYEKIVVEALQGESLPKTEFTVRRMADLLIKNGQMGLELTPQQIATLVREDYQTEIKSVLGQTDGDVLLKMLGDDVANKIRKADLARLKAGMPNLPKPTVDVAKADFTKKETKRYKNMDQWREEVDARTKNLPPSVKK